MPTRGSRAPASAVALSEAGWRAVFFVNGAMMLFAGLLWRGWRCLCCGLPPAPRF
jgi:hypothetical protein